MSLHAGKKVSDENFLLFNCFGDSAKDGSLQHWFNICTFVSVWTFHRGLTAEQPRLLNKHITMTHQPCPSILHLYTQGWKCRSLAKREIVNYHSIFADHFTVQLHLMLSGKCMSALKMGFLAESSCKPGCNETFIHTKIKFAATDM